MFVTEDIFTFWIILSLVVFIHLLIAVNDTNLHGAPHMELLSASCDIAVEEPTVLGTVATLLTLVCWCNF